MKLGADVGIKNIWKNLILCMSSWIAPILIWHSN